MLIAAARPDAQRGSDNPRKQTATTGHLVVALTADGDAALAGAPGRRAWLFFMLK
jgi:hypothetical protein